VPRGCHIQWPELAPPTVRGDCPAPSKDLDVKPKPKRPFNAQAFLDSAGVKKKIAVYRRGEVIFTKFQRFGFTDKGTGSSLQVRCKRQINGDDESSLAGVCRPDTTVMHPHDSLCDCEA
jgi:hypothetical protein